MKIDNYFSLFDLPDQYNIDEKKLNVAWLNLVEKVHPDRFIHSVESEKNACIKLMAKINEAYRILRDPIERTKYICEIKGINLENNKDSSQEFFLKQMEWHERLENAVQEKDKNSLKEIKIELHGIKKDLLGKIYKIFEDDRNFSKISKLMNELIFIERIFKNCLTFDVNDK